MLDKFRSAKLPVLTVALSSALLLAACGGDGNNNNENADAPNNNNNNNNNNGEETVELGGEDITIPYVAWAGSTSRSPVLAKALEEVGYNVSLDQVEGGPMWTSVADDEDTLSATAWLPATHGEYLDEYEDDVEVYDEANLVDTAPLSLTVPEYMIDEYDIESIEDLKDNEELGEDLDWTITGIDPGAGIMENTEKAIENYELDEWDLQESSEAAMIADLQEKYENEEPIIVTGWEPHWIFADMDLEMLEDPDEIYGGEGDQIQMIFNKDFEEAHPAAYKIATQFVEDWSEDDEDELMPPIFVDDEDPEDVAQEFIDDNPDRLETWTEGVDVE